MFVGMEQPLEGQQGCVFCQNGTFNPGDSPDGCIECPVGSFSAINETEFVALTSCQKCDFGAYASIPGSTECTRCPAGETTSLIGASSITACICSSGFYRTYKRPAIAVSNVSVSDTANGTDGTAMSVNQTAEEETGLFVKDVCLPCQKRTICNQGDDFPLIEPGWWAREFDRSKPFQQAELYMCIPREACPGNQSNACEDNREDLVCGKCRQGHFAPYRHSGKCFDCGSTNLAGPAFLVIFSMPVFTFFFMWVATSPRFKKGNGLLLIFVFLQEVAVINSFNLRLPKNVQIFFGACEIFLFTPIAFRLNCVGLDAFEEQQYFALFLPVVFVLTVLTLFGVSQLIPPIAQLLEEFIDRKTREEQGQLFGDRPLPAIESSSADNEELSDSEDENDEADDLRESPDPSEDGNRRGGNNMRVEGAASDGALANAQTGSMPGPAVPSLSLPPRTVAKSGSSIPAKYFHHQNESTGVVFASTQFRLFGIKTIRAPSPSCLSPDEEPEAAASSASPPPPPLPLPSSSSSNYTDAFEALQSFPSHAATGTKTTTNFNPTNTNTNTNNTYSDLFTPRSVGGNKAMVSPRFAASQRKMSGGPPSQPETALHIASATDQEAEEGDASGRRQEERDEEHKAGFCDEEGPGPPSAESCGDQDNRETIAEGTSKQKVKQLAFMSFPVMSSIGRLPHQAVLKIQHSLHNLAETAKKMLAPRPAPNVELKPLRSIIISTRLFSLTLRPLPLSTVYATILTVFTTFFIAFCRMTFVAIDCYKHPTGEWSVLEYPYILCGGASESADRWRAFLWMTALAILIYVAGTYVVVVRFAILLHYRWCDRGFVSFYGALMDKYASGKVWWAVVWITRNLLIALSTTVLPKQGMYQLQWITCIIVAYLVLLQFNDPWRRKKDVYLDRWLSIFYLHILTLVALHIDQDEDRFSSTNNIFLFVEVIGILLFIFFSIILVAIRRMPGTGGFWTALMSVLIDRGDPIPSSKSSKTSFWNLRVNQYNNYTTSIPTGATPSQGNDAESNGSNYSNSSVDPSGRPRRAYRYAYNTARPPKSASTATGGHQGTMHHRQSKKLSTASHLGGAQQPAVDRSLPPQPPLSLYHPSPSSHRPSTLMQDERPSATHTQLGLLYSSGQTNTASMANNAGDETERERQTANERGALIDGLSFLPPSYPSAPALKPQVDYGADK
ncbi:unnamed protein product [Vitrella brassicaformis CCMP3155]|uniref:Tyrosine-protein kinase ephrin type A/B receptor-like domain-containing protein n=2 Tax=Vitrella brassicaformis TaxID=1169539 RepID=A0A0G4EZQ6_VITBC|nr:unnamed protein product [Vitrella brassicaformis CCMP3155]|eukprot:CEM04308.1 unnamed protein product [Vitrella brassicaformis CCMP3155]